MSIQEMTTRFTGYLDRDEGAVTVDFVALMSMICLFGIAVAITVNTATDESADRVAAELDEMSIWTY